MKPIIRQCIFVSVAILLSNCNKPVVKPPEPVASPTPASTPLPTPTATPIFTPTPVIPTPTIVPTPQARLAPQGTLYVIKSFSITTDTGIYGFPVGKKVNLVREESGMYFVTDGKMEGSAPQASFTNDLDIVDAKVMGIKTAFATAIEQSKISSQEYSGKTEQILFQQERDRQKKRIAALDKQIEDAEYSIRDLEELISRFRHDGIIEESAENKTRRDQIKMLERQIPIWQEERGKLRENIHD